MKTLNLKQGSEEWLEVRGQYPTASEASIMMGASDKCSRAELLRMKATGDKQEFSKWVEEVLFEKGKQVEEKARPIAEKIIGEDLYPVVGLSDDKSLLASLDGATIDDDVIWECKQWNEEKATSIRLGIIPECDKWQVVQQLAVSGANCCLYMVTDGEIDLNNVLFDELGIDEENTIAMAYMPNHDDEADLRAGWQQFYEDLKNYKHVEVVEAPVGKAPEQLPSLSIQVTGKVTESNLSEFKEHALAVFGGINKELKTDEDFANADKTVKWCKGVEDKLESTKQHALSQTESIERLFNTIDSIKEEAKRVRIDLDKLVKKRKQDVRSEIMQEARDNFNSHVARMNSSLDDGFYLPEQKADFAGAMKNKRTVKSLRDAVDQVLADAKIAANEICATMYTNIKALKDDAKNHNFLFKDYAQIVLKDPEDLVNLIKSRIADYNQQEKDRIEKEREEMRVEEERKAEARLKKEQEDKAAEAKRLKDEKGLEEIRLEERRGEILRARNREALVNQPEPVSEVEPEPEVVDVHIPKNPTSKPATPKCDGNHGGPKCADPECWNDDPVSEDPLIFNLNGCVVVLRESDDDLGWTFQIQKNKVYVGESLREYSSRESALADVNIFTEILIA